ncbi:molybdate ABC transporter substrate-binding protein [Methanothermobacter wolfeii]|uniref:molybdate ABC transporter substrate-binding protein n=1 Tax=Methanothermobacter wolfeii TaxID=145261 RepID=UPI0024B33FD1|nr:molybdate ABC transporter substrate-binding protein [Methanothermobacter wolfeii]MDI6703006.1 molybdate ABC transporter substrate-binding protein [Methanothermobacter wolfeii]
MGLVIVCGFIGACFIPSSHENTKRSEITVLAGAGLMKPMNELTTNFEKNTGVKINVQYGGSGELLGTLMTSKKGDVLIVGERTNIEKAKEKGYMLNDTIVNITSHEPVIAIKKGNPKDIHSLKDLSKENVKIAIGDPQACAIGKVSEQLFNKHGISPNIVAKTPTVNQLLTYIISGQVDAVIIWGDMLTWPESRSKIEIIKIEGVKNQTILAGVTSISKNPEISKEFVRYLKSNESKVIWEKWGFKLID